MLGITDIWFPFSQASLPTMLSPSAQGKFLTRQAVVLSKSLLFEKNADRKHAYFAQGEPLPFQVVAKLGSGAHAHVDKVISTVSHREYARKLFRRQRGVSKDAVKSFLIELQVLKRVQHIHCVELVRIRPPRRS
jgi:serine/threonine protein kinase